MKKVALNLTVAEATDRLKVSLKNKGFTLFSDIDHQANATSVDLEMPESRVLIFGNPAAGTQLMQKDIFMSLDLPLRLAVVNKKGQTFFIHQTTDDYSHHYNLKDHPVLEKIEGLFSTLTSELG